MVKACIVGLGSRGHDLIQYLLVMMKDLEIVSVCDVYEDRVEEAKRLLREAGRTEPIGFTDWKAALNVAGLDACFIFSNWATHTEIALYAMEKGIAVGSEVGCEYSLENCFNLVKTQERTGTPYMFLENCCYGRDELLATSMARRGLFGTIVHCSGAYAHDLRNSVAYGRQKRHYRLDNYLYRNCDNYPTHDLGPIAKLLDINRGNRILTVSSFASKAAGLYDYIATREDATDEMRNADFAQGDIINTMITCAGGETIQLTLDTTLPRFYDRAFTVRGTKGMYTQTLDSVFLDGDSEELISADYAEKNVHNSKAFEEEYLPAIHKNITKEAIDAGHSGMDWFVYRAFVEAVKNGTPMPIDVYDGAVWQAVAVLSEESIAKGGAPVAMPDFTGGKWLTRKRLDVCEMP